MESWMVLWMVNGSVESRTMCFHTAVKSEHFKSNHGKLGLLMLMKNCLPELS